MFRPALTSGLRHAVTGEPVVKTGRIWFESAGLIPYYIPCYKRQR